MSRIASILLVASVTISALSSRAEDNRSELERALEKKCADLTVSMLELNVKFKDDNPQKREAAELLENLRHVLERTKAENRERREQLLSEKLKSLEQHIQAMKGGGKERMDAAMLQFLEQARMAVMKKLIELDVGPLPFPDDPAKTADKKQAGAQNSALHVQLQNGAILQAEGNWLQMLPETRDILEQFVDPAKDGAVTFHVPEQLDPDAVKQIFAVIGKIAPKAELQYSEKLHLLSATSEDAAQLRRVASVFKNLRPGGPPPEFNPKWKGQPPPPPPDEENRKFQPGQPNPKGKEEMKKKPDPVDDKF